MHQIIKNVPKLKERPQAAPGEFTLIDQLLAEQKQLQTPVARFSEIHHRKAPDPADQYHSLIPLSKPGPGEQYAFEVSLDRCTGCKACVSACHSLNGLDDHEAWRDIGVLHSKGWQQTITTACHHCADPGCLSGCPVGAYEKEKDSGIVRHLDDQCIGCSYCILKCPYDVPKYSKKRGIVRKCDMCHQRLAEGEAPACVQACPTEAIRIVKRSVEPAAPAASPILGDTTVTNPMTRYVGREIPESALAADRETLVPQHAHWPLVIMLTLTQAGIGLLAAPVYQGSTSITVLIAATLIFFTGMAASVLHLGQPLKAWRFFLGLRTSWLSREILAFSMFAPIPLVLTALHFAPDFPFKSYGSLITAHSALPLGLAAVFTSVMIYVDTHRSTWRFPITAVRFFGTAMVFAALSFTLAGATPLLTAAAIVLKLIPEIRFARLAEDPDGPWSPDVHTARLQTGPLGIFFRIRIVLCLTAGVASIFQPWLALPLLLAAEILERQLFFQSVHAPKMPGNFGPSHGPAH
jgi:formate dehydrogenase iron-sulfur subunit